jgi:hypothetical protein
MSTLIGIRSKPRQQRQKLLVRKNPLHFAVLGCSNLPGFCRQMVLSLHVTSAVTSYAGGCVAVWQLPSIGAVTKCGSVTAALNRRRDQVGECDSYQQAAHWACVTV